MGDVPPVPMPPSDSESAKLQLALVLDRMVYVLKRVAAEPALLLDGRYHESSRAAVHDLDRRLTEVTDKEGWTYYLRKGQAAKPDVDRALLDHGLNGPQWVLKFQAFGQHFEQFLDRMARLEQHTMGLHVRLSELEVEDFKVRVRSARESTSATLEVGKPIVESAAAAIPGGGAVLGAVNELGGVFKGLVSWAQS